MRGKPLVEMVNISKNFGSIQALRNVDFKVYKGEVVGLVGDNGAGKSTLIRILSGIYQQTEGEVHFKGEKVSIRSPRDAMKLGIETVHQGFGLLSLMDVSRNLFLGAEPTKKVGPFEFLDLNKMEKEGKKMLRRIGIMTDITADSELGTLSGGQQQAIKIGRTLYFEAELVILDEPALGLSVRESTRVFGLIEELKKEKAGVIYVTHNIAQIYDSSDRIVILESGSKIGEFLKKETSVEEIREIIGKGGLEKS